MRLLRIADLGHEACRTLRNVDWLGTDVHYPKRNLDKYLLELPHLYLYSWLQWCSSDATACQCNLDVQWKHAHLHTMTSVGYLLHIWSDAVGRTEVQTKYGVVHEMAQGGLLTRYYE